MLAPRLLAGGCGRRFYQFDQESYGINAARSAKRPNARLLGIPAGSPLLRIQRTALTCHNVPVELRTSMVNTAECD
jgi:DNA-binding GntR family transcriptional regulator